MWSYAVKLVSLFYNAVADMGRSQVLHCSVPFFGTCEHVITERAAAESASSSQTRQQYLSLVGLVVAVVEELHPSEMSASMVGQTASDCWDHSSFGVTLVHYLPAKAKVE